MESATITATYHDGTLTLQEPIDLPDGSHVEVRIRVLPLKTPL
jgi:predicted DNA-binding antitoxin AbrB/MazE fold protein